MDRRTLVSVVDDDESVRESLPDLLRELGFAAHAFESGEMFLTSDDLAKTKCVVLDVAMPRVSGLDVQRELKARRLEIPVVFITAHKDDSVRQRALEEGAAAYLLKPFSDTTLLQALRNAMNLS